MKSIILKNKRIFCNTVKMWRITHSNTKAELKKFMSSWRKKYKPKNHFQSKYQKKNIKNKYQRKMKEECAKINLRNW